MEVRGIKLLKVGKTKKIFNGKTYTFQGTTFEKRHVARFKKIAKDHNFHFRVVKRKQKVTGTRYQMWVRHKKEKSLFKGV